MRFSFRATLWLILLTGPLLPLRAQTILLQLDFDNSANRLENTGSSGTGPNSLGFYDQGNGLTYNVGGGIRGGTSAVFDGNSWLLADYSPVTTAFSITFWMKTTMVAPGGSQWYEGPGIIDGEIGGVTQDWGIGQLGNQVVAGIGDPDETIFSSSDIVTGNWTFVAATWDSATGGLNLYVDGVLEAFQPGTSTGTRRTDQSFFIGYDYNGYTFSGELDQIQFYDSALNLTQLTNLQNGGSITPVPEPSTFALLLAAGGLGWIFRRRVAIRSAP